VTCGFDEAIDGVRPIDATSDDKKAKHQQQMCDSPHVIKAVLLEAGSNPHTKHN
jgi:hypothetical protein